MQRVLRPRRPRARAAEFVYDTDDDDVDRGAGAAPPAPQPAHEEEPAGMTMEHDDGDAAEEQQVGRDDDDNSVSSYKDEGKRKPRVKRRRGRLNAPAYIQSLAALPVEVAVLVLKYMHPLSLSALPYTAMAFRLLITELKRQPALRQAALAKLGRNKFHFCGPAGWGMTFAKWKSGRCVFCIVRTARVDDYGMGIRCWCVFSRLILKRFAPPRPRALTCTGKTITVADAKWTTWEASPPTRCARSTSSTRTT